GAHGPSLYLVGHNVTSRQRFRRIWVLFFLLVFIFPIVVKLRLNDASPFCPKTQKSPSELGPQFRCNFVALGPCLIDCFPPAGGCADTSIRFCIFFLLFVTDPPAY
ncbi:unnamed protein product, partial [Ectocarpus sp. 12 AP-2014]